MVNLSGKTALVTGASRGIGRASALALAEGGAQVPVHYGHGKAEAESVVAEIRNGGGRAQARPGCSDPGSVYAAKCETCHIRPEGSALSIKWPGPLGIEDRTHDNAADGVLVVQVRRLRTIYRDISELAAREALVKILRWSFDRTIASCG